MTLDSWIGKLGVFPDAARANPLGGVGRSLPWLVQLSFGRAQRMSSVERRTRGIVLRRTTLAFAAM
jgi:hypothetical protein